MDYEMKFLIGDYVKGKRTFNGEVIEGKFNGFRLYNKLNPKSVVGVIVTDERCYDVSVDSIELVEGEDKKWKNWLIGHLKGYINQTDNKYAEVCKNAITWLEKQGEQKHIDKVEPYQIEKGKWYVCNTSRYTDFIVGKAYYCHKNGMLKPNENEMARYVARNCFHLWTIQDAKDGDVLCTYECDEPKIVFILKGIPKKHYALSYHCYYNIMYPHFESDSEKGCLGPNDEDVKPATKEQRDLLFQKMKEAGYEWDFEKKELKKI